MIKEDTKDIDEHKHTKGGINDLIDLKLSIALETHNHDWQDKLNDICHTYDKRIEKYTADLDDSNAKVLVLTSQVIITLTLPKLSITCETPLATYYDGTCI